MKNIKADPKILLIGIGNSGRGDDGLGWQFIEKIDSLGYDFIDLEYRYQLQVEDAAVIRNYDVVIFVDATQDKLSLGFEINSCIAASHSFFTTHEQAPGAILALANMLYEKFPKAYTLAISGTEWELQTFLSKDGQRNLETAVSFFIEQFLPTISPDIAVSY